MRMKKTATFICVVMGLLLSAGFGCVGEKEEPEWYLRPGDALPAFEVATIDGKRISSADSYEAEMVIVFFNTDCPDCRRELPEIQKRYDENQMLPESDRDIYICIAREEGEADIVGYWEANHLTLPVSPQPDRYIYSLFASVGIPRVFYARDGKILRTE